MIFKEEIKAAYGYEKVYSVSAVSCITALNCRNERQNHPSSDSRMTPVKFADVLQKSIAVRNQEVECSVYGYGKTGAYEEYLYHKREYRH